MIRRYDIVMKTVKVIPVTTMACFILLIATISYQSYYMFFSHNYRHRHHHLCPGATPLWIGLWPWSHQGMLRHSASAWEAGWKHTATCLCVLQKPHLVGGLEHFLFSHIFGIIIPIDVHIFQRGSNHQPVMSDGLAASLNHNDNFPSFSRHLQTHSGNRTGRIGEAWSVWMGKKQYVHEIDPEQFCFEEQKQTNKNLLFLFLSCWNPQSLLVALQGARAFSIWLLWCASPQTKMINKKKHVLLDDNPGLVNPSRGHLFVGVVV